MEESDQNYEPSSARPQRTTSVDEAAVQTAFTRGPEDPLIGQLFAQKYRVLSKLGAGGMSAVYKANDVLLNRPVALKILLPQRKMDVTDVLRFQQEARSASHLNNPHIITIYEFTVPKEGQPYLVMDFVQGESLAELIARPEPLSVERCLDLFMQSCDGLMHAHDKGVLHRDLKPSNIMISKTSFGEDFVSIVDFGIAKIMVDEEGQQLQLTQTGEVFGSPYYMSPEQCKGEKADARSDIYSLGCLMYEALSGKPPFRAGNAMQTFYKHITEPPEPFSLRCPERKIPEALEDIIQKTLLKERAERYQSVHELYSDLKDLKTQLLVEKTLSASATKMQGPATAASASKTTAAPKTEVPDQSAEKTANQSLMATASLPPATENASGFGSEPGSTTAGLGTTTAGQGATANQPSAPASTASSGNVDQKSSPASSHARPEIPPALAKFLNTKYIAAFSAIVVVLSVALALCTEFGANAGAGFLASTGSAGEPAMIATAQWARKDHRYQAAALLYRTVGELRLARNDGKEANENFVEAIIAGSQDVARAETSQAADKALDNMQAIATEAPGPVNDVELTRLLDLAEKLRTKGLTLQARKTNKITLALIAKSPTTPFDTIATATDQLANSYVQEKQFEPMSIEFQEQTKDLQRGFGRHSAVATACRQRALAEYNMKNFKAAAVLYREATTMFETDKGASDSYMAAAYYELACTYANLKNSSEARLAYKRAVDIYESIGDDAHVRLARQGLASLPSSGRGAPPPRQTRATARYGSYTTTSSYSSSSYSSRNSDQLGRAVTHVLKGFRRLLH